MNFIKQMKKREFVELGIKTVIGLLIGVVVALLLEGMIYNIYMKKIDENKSINGYNAPTYYISKNKDDTYDVYQTYTNGNGGWMRESHNVSKAVIDNRTQEKGELNGFNMDLYKIVVVDLTTNSETPYVSSSGNSPFSRVELEWSTNTNLDNYAFDIYCRESTEASFDDVTTPQYDNYDYSRMSALFNEAGLYRQNPDAEIIWRKPNPFDIYMNWGHYLAITIFLVAIGGVYVWRFMATNKEYKKIERRFQKTGKIF